MSRSASKISNEGVLHLPLALLFSCIATTGFYLLTLMHNFRVHAENQLEMDACIQRVSVELQQTLESIENENKLIDINRLALQAAGNAHPATAAALRATLIAIVIRQDSQLLQWKIKQAKWLVQACQIRDHLRTPLPSLLWNRNPPDSIGPQKLVWPTDQNKELKIVLLRKKLHSSSVIENTKQKPTWSARWTSLH